jgi:hypothetical protein
VRGDVSVDSETLLVTDFVNLKIKLAQSFEVAHRSRVCVRIFIAVSAHTYINIYICTIFLKNSRDNWWTRPGLGRATVVAAPLTWQLAIGSKQPTRGCCCRWIGKYF